MNARPLPDKLARVTHPPAYRAWTERHLDQIRPLGRLPAEDRFAMRVVSSVLPFRTNNFVVEELIDWERVPDDPMFQLTFPQRGMLTEDQFLRMADALRRRAPRAEVQTLAREIRKELNAHPAGQLSFNRPRLNGRLLRGVQHKYRETVLYFPTQGQTCHAYCTFCFRWAQFVGDPALRIASSEADELYAYLRRHPEVSDLLITGGDPMIMKTRTLAAHLAPLLEPGLEHIRNLRIGTKALSFWPHRFTSDADADELIRLLERLVASGRHVSLMAHYNHPRELEPEAATKAISRLRQAGVTLRAQGPLVAHINDEPAVWAELWTRQLRQGIIPYYLFVERNTGARNYFEVPLAQAWRIYREAIGSVSGLARTVRGPSMSAAPGKVEIEGVSKVAGEKVFVLRFLQGRNPDWVHRPFFARYDRQATWLDQLRPAFGEKRFFFEREFAGMTGDLSTVTG